MKWERERLREHTTKTSIQNNGALCTYNVLSEYFLYKSLKEWQKYWQVLECSLNEHLTLTPKIIPSWNICSTTFRLPANPA